MMGTHSKAKSVLIWKHLVAILIAVLFRHFICLGSCIAPTYLREYPAVMGRHSNMLRNTVMGIRVRTTER